MDLIVSKAVSQIIKNIEFQITKAEREKEKLESEETTLKRTSITIKGLEISSERDIQEMYGVGEITERQYEKYLKQLEDTQTNSDITFEKEVQIAKIRMLKNILKNCISTKEDAERK